MAAATAATSGRAADAVRRVAANLASATGLDPEASLVLETSPASATSRTLARVAATGTAPDVVSAPLARSAPLASALQAAIAPLAKNARSAKTAPAEQIVLAK